LPAISIGIDSGDPIINDPSSDETVNWTQNVLAIGLANGFVPAFISDHSYAQTDPGNESDNFLLNDTVTNSASVLDWSTRYADYESLMASISGFPTSSVTVMATEYNSVSTNPGKQSTSLVNGLFIADSLGSLLDSGYGEASIWGLRNGWDTSYDNSNSLYGWREGGDYGLLGSANDTDLPDTGAYVPYPSYFALQLASKIIVPGGEVVSAVSSYSDLEVYSVSEANGSLALLVVNTNPSAAISDAVTVSGFTPIRSMKAWQYGETQDTAQSASATGASALAFTSPTVTVTGGNAFTYTFPAYSMTVLVLAKTPSILKPATGTATTSGKTVALSALGGSVLGASGLTYSWASSPSSGVSFSVNGTTAAANTTATFTTAGTYTLTVTIQDSGGYSTTSTLTIVVNSGLSNITITNGTSSTVTGLTFNNSSVSYSIAAGSGSSIYLSNGSSNASIVVSTGSDTISAPVVMDSNVSIAPASGTTLTLSGTISSSNALTVDGAGTVILSGTNTYTGGTAVTEGTLDINGAAALEAGTSLVIGSTPQGALVESSDAEATAVASVVATATAAPATAALSTTSSTESVPVPVTSSGAVSTVLPSLVESETATAPTTVLSVAAAAKYNSKTHFPLHLLESAERSAMPPIAVAAVAKAVSHRSQSNPAGKVEPILLALPASNQEQSASAVDAYFSSDWSKSGPRLAILLAKPQ
jgi:autotransporter-associated beta strand protein